MKKLLLFFVALFLACSTAWAGEKVSFTYKKEFGGEQTITAELIKPPGKGPFPAMVYLHGCAGFTPASRQWSVRLVDWGYAVFLVDSFSARGVKSICGDYFKVSPVVRAADANGALAYLAERPDIDKKRIGVLGMSHGGWTLLRLIQASYQPQCDARFRAAVALYPYCDQMLDQATAPVLILIGEKDEFCPAKLCVDRIPRGKCANEVIVKVYPGAHHAFDIKAVNHKLRGKQLLYDPNAAADAIDRAKTFLAKHMQ